MTVIDLDKLGIDPNIDPDKKNPWGQNNKNKFGSGGGGRGGGLPKLPGGMFGFFGLLALIAIGLLLKTGLYTVPSDSIGAVSYTHLTLPTILLV